MPPPPPPPTPAPGVPVVRLLPRRPCAPPESSPPRSAAAGDKKRRPPERPEVPLSSSWPSATLKRSPRPGPGPSTSQPPTSVRATPQTSPAHAGIPAAATCTAPPRARCCHSSAGVAAAGISVGAEAGPDDAMRFSLSLTPEAILVIQRRHLEKQLLARPRRSFPSPSPEARRPQVPSPRARASGLRRGGTSSVPDAPPAAGLRRSPRASLLPGGLQSTVPSPRVTDLRPVVKVSLLNEQHKYDDVEYEEETDVVDEGLVRKCTEWLRGVESAAAARGRTHHLDSLPHLSTL